MRDLLWALIGLAWLVWKAPGVKGHEKLRETYAITYR